MSVSLRAAKTVFRLDILLGLMVLASIAIVAVPERFLQTSLDIEPRNYHAELIEDVYTGGNSRARWLNEQARLWECQLDQETHEPFCSMQLDLVDDEGLGLDLRRFDKMTIWAEYRGSAKHLRLYLRNRHPNYYDPAISISTKFNMVEMPVRDLASGLTIRMDDFTVAGWWLIGGNIPLADSHPEFNEVSIIELQTGSEALTGTHEIQLKKISWSGSIVKQSTLYKAVIIAWSVVIFLILVNRLVTSQREFKRQREAQKELLAINASLDLETRRFEELAKTDLMTGLRNRVGIRDTLYRGLVDWRTTRAPFSFILIDLDNFKSINDTYGHDVGDKVLQDAAKLMTEQLRHSDTLARWGGEEFVIACPDTSVDRAAQIAEKLRATLEAGLTCHERPVTASFGVASMTEPNLDALFKKADVALYQAKQLGRNRVCTER